MAYSWKKQASAAYGYSMVRLALQVFMYMEDLPQSYEGVLEKQKGTDERFMELLGQYLAGELTEGSLGAFRDSLVSQMETAIAFADCFRIYEYAWNRLERRFVPDLKPTGMSDGEMTRALMGYLTADRDAALMNQRIQQMIGQLPVRFTRQKYYGMVRDALTSYIGSDMEGLQNEMYLLRTGAMVELSEEQKASEPELRDLLDSLQAMSMRDATAEQYQNAQANIRLAGSRLVAMSEYLQMMQEMVNDLYVLLLTRKAAIRDEGLEEHAGCILTGLYQAYQEKAVSIPEEISEELSFLEGMQEEYFEAYSRLEPVPASFVGEGKGDWNGKKVERLLSSSPYASLDEEKVQETVTADVVETAANGFIASLEPVFAVCQKPVMRAVMAATLSCLPVCFNSLDEIQKYIEGSFGSCADPAEKETCKELLLQMMEMDEYDAMV